MNDKRLANLTIIFIGVILLFALLMEFQSFLRPFVIAVVLTFLLVPFTRYTGGKKFFMILGTIAIVSILFVSLGFLGSVLIEEAVKLNQNIPVAQEHLESLFTNENLMRFEFGANQFSLDDIVDVKKVLSFVENSVLSILKGLTAMFSETFLVLVFLMFMLPTHDRFIDRVAGGLDSTLEKKLRNAIFKIEKNVRAYLYTKTLISLGTALISGVIMFFFDVRFMYIYMFLIFAFNFIPNIGSIVAVGIVLVAYGFTFGLTSQLALLALLLVLVQLLFGNYIEPKFAGRKLELSPVIVLLSLFFWGAIWGIPGMFLAVPLTSIAKIILENIEGMEKLASLLS